MESPHNLIEEYLSEVADKLRGSMGASEHDFLREIRTHLEEASDCVSQFFDVRVDEDSCLLYLDAQNIAKALVCESHRVNNLVLVDASPFSELESYARWKLIGLLGRRLPGPFILFDGLPTGCFRAVSRRGRLVGTQVTFQLLS